MELIQMPRKPRKLSSTGIYHIMTRGIDRMAIFHDDEDREKYLEILAACLPGEQRSSGNGFFCHTEGQVEDSSLVPASCDKGGRPQPTADCAKGTVLNPALLYNYCLMDNHVHLLIKTGSEPLSHLMKRICVRYAAFFKWKYHRTGHLFQDRFRSEPVEDKAYLLAVYRYITLNPVTAGLCEKPGTYPWCGVRSIGDGFFCHTERGTEEPSSMRGYARVGDGSLVPTSCDKGNRPQPTASCDIFCHTERGTEELSSMRSLKLTPLPIALTREEIWDYICADAPEIHPFAERVLDGEAKDLLLQYADLQNPLDAASIPRNEQIILFSRLQEEGISIQQMARLTGIAKTNIARWLS